jgi:hypothetical protein
VRQGFFRFFFAVSSSGLVFSTDPRVSSLRVLPLAELANAGTAKSSNPLCRYSLVYPQTS